MGKKTPEERLKELAKGVTDAAQPYLEKAQPYLEKAQPYLEKAQPYFDDLKSKAEPVVDDLVNKAEPVYEDVKAKAQPYIDDIKTKAEPVIDLVKEKTAPAAHMASDAAKAAMDGLTNQSARINCKEEVFVQYNNHEVRMEDIVSKAKIDYVNRGHKLSDIKEIQIYIKPVDNAVYYVINHRETGKLEFSHGN